MKTETYQIPNRVMGEIQKLAGTKWDRIHALLKSCAETPDKSQPASAEES